MTSMLSYLRRSGCNISLLLWLLGTGTFKLIRKCIDGKGFSGTKRYFGDLEKTVSSILFNYQILLTLHSQKLSMCFLQLRTAGSNVLFAAVTEISDSVLRGSETSGFNGMVQLIFSTIEYHNKHFVIFF